jgi:sugar lactone lactonase YvrE
MTQEIRTVYKGGDELGEVPIWCPKTKNIWWIDVRKPNVQRLDPASGDHQVYPLPGQTVGSWAFREGGGAVVGLNDGLHALDFESGQTEILVSLESEEEFPGNRLNDAKCDRRGRYWVGTMHNTIREPRGSFYRIDTDLSFEKMFGDVVIPNSVCMSPDDTVLYFTDSWKKVIWAFDFDIDAGALSNRRVFADLTDRPGIPDGSTVDTDGCLWNAEFGGARVVRFTPGGKIDRMVDVPTSQPTCCAFGGDRLDTLYITTATQRMTAEQLTKEPLAGALLAIEPGVRGLPEPGFGG